MNKPNKIITIHDIAREAGVSTATVSRAMNQSHKVSAYSYSRVTAAIERLNQKTTVSDAIVSNKEEKKNVLLNLPHLGNPVFLEFLDGINAAAKRHGWHVIINADEITKNTADEFLQLIECSRSAGLISMKCSDSNALKYLNDHIPVVQCMEANPDIGVPYVRVDDYAASFSAVEYLVTTGRRSIGAIITTTMHNSVARYRGYQDALKKHGLSEEPSLVVWAMSLRTNMIRTIIRKAIGNFKTTPDAFFCCSDQAASAALIALSEFGYQVPRDVALMGYDNSDIAELTIPKLSTVNYSKYQAGYLACEMLYDISVNPQIVLHNTVLDTELVIRQST